MLLFARYAGAVLAFLAACRPDAPAEHLPTAPLLEAVPTGYTYSLVVAEERVNRAGYRYTRNRYASEYPFCPVAVARPSDTVAYARAYLLRANVPRPDTLYPDGPSNPPRRLPYEADQLDTTRQVLLRFSLRPLRRSTTPADY